MHVIEGKGVGNPTYGAWTATGRQERVGSNRKLECRCQCGSVKLVLETRLRAGQSRSCGCLRGKHVQESRSANPDLFDIAGNAIPPNGYAVVLTGSVRGEKWAAGSPGAADPWYVGPKESECALRFSSRAHAKEWIRLRRASVRSPGTYTIGPLAFSDVAPRWAPATPTAPVAIAVNNRAVGGLDWMRA